jgi:hypothetical protein
MKQIFKVRIYKDLLWKYTTTTTMSQFEQGIEEVKEVNPKAYKWLQKMSSTSWSRSYFSGISLSILCFIGVNCRHYIMR